MISVENDQSAFGRLVFYSAMSLPGKVGVVDQQRKRVPRWQSVKALEAGCFGGGGSLNQGLLVGDLRA